MLGPLVVSLRDDESVESREERVLELDARLLLQALEHLRVVVLPEVLQAQPDRLPLAKLQVEGSELQCNPLNGSPNNGSILGWSLSVMSVVILMSNVRQLFQF